MNREQPKSLLERRQHATTATSQQQRRQPLPAPPLNSTSTVIALESVEQWQNIVAGHASKTLLVCFHTKWCRPCDSAMRLVQACAHHFSLLCVTVDVDEELQLLAERFHVRTLPTLVLLDKDRRRTLRRLEGADPEEMGEMVEFLRGSEEPRCVCLQTLHTKGSCLY